METQILIFFQAAEKLLAGAIRREMALQEHCSMQSAEINQLKRLVDFIKLFPHLNFLISDFF